MGDVASMNNLVLGRNDKVEKPKVVMGVRICHWDGEKGMA